MSTLSTAALGALRYRDGLALQESLVRARAEQRTGDWLLFPEHEPVLTIGRGGREGSVLVDRPTLERLGIEVFEVARGGDVTWHGPGQLVGYVVCDLDRRDRDMHRFLRDLEEALIRSLAGFGIAGERSPGRTGVWVEGRKIASIGVAVRRWVSYHGFALNVAPDLASFDLIHPCGLRGIRMTAMAAELGEKAPAFTRVRETVAASVAETLGFERLIWEPAEAAWSAAELAAPPRPEPAHAPAPRPEQGLTAA